MDRNDRIDEEFKTRGGIDSFVGDEPDEIDTHDDEFFEDTGPNTGPPNKVENNRTTVSKYENDPVYKDVQQNFDECRRKATKNGQTKDILFAIMCLIMGLLGIIAIVVGVIIACGAYNNPFNKTQSQSTVGIPANLDSENISVHYDPSGQMHINVYVEKRPDLDINVTIDENGEASVEAMVHDDETTSEHTTESTTESTTENTTEENVSDNTIEGDTTEDLHVPDSNTETDISVSESGISTDPITPEMEKELLKQMEQRISEGGSGYLESDKIYVVGEGDTLTKISRDTGFSIDFLANYNHIQDKNLIITSESIRIPVFTPVNQ